MVLQMGNVMHVLMIVYRVFLLVSVRSVRMGRICMGGCVGHRVCRARMLTRWLMSVWTVVGIVSVVIVVAV